MVVCHINTTKPKFKFLILYFANQFFENMSDIQLDERTPDLHDNEENEEEEEKEEDKQKQKKSKVRIIVIISNSSIKF